ncbi:bifunctional heparan sulfate N-deacetylase/N-sulfotransferase-like [Paramacrobiotus metropolitanus]|uniref:bifunctional heparan sulfate N-deacetylase/N-sulfotransferase-like n=1 Tax=Paramacrobiotus metropolitanus TaxID=2943436 RepID=UPI0024460DE2|nr:bifunctional heparan sulfate N-deacetylase/N-sulfotransferase-like [Paramacrobiotus metropolitanus]XP_055331919.1 bifunctional heparan sulfate N-deacetylase/N-sulfotransferase-like [Paramacrobiotus metropolitanus]XP_055331920.1 bifunctional heparan sulfate N-deacetylase/N-sulfotransferase-like [Paramacrobiotus metropolitanus]XP_055331921.1 bifunctional heparan sulfate N-deacetylase/N-sulfotransferase-like [Paramacrobiotus metropolitanus]XP_055331922.1 bifunctional heparan sulfate N-deacetyla
MIPWEKMTGNGYKSGKMKPAVRMDQSWLMRYLRAAALSRSIVLTFIVGLLSLLLLGWWVAVKPDEIAMKTTPNGRADDIGGPDPVIELPRPVSVTTTLPRLKYEPKVLVFAETQYSPLGRDIVTVLEAVRKKFRVELGGKNVPVLTSEDRGKFSLIVFENVDKYFKMDKWNRDLLDRYCREYHVGIIGFPPLLEHTLIGATVPNMQMLMHTNVQLQDYTVNVASPVLHLTKGGQSLEGVLPGDDWTVFVPKHETYEIVAWALLSSPLNSTPSANSTQLPTVVLDTGKLDGVRRVFFGQSLKFWLHKMLFLDAMGYLINGGHQLMPLTRYILIDVDDIFVGRKGTRMNISDVQAMISTMMRWRKTVAGFRFNLGFSGKYFHAGFEEENKGDDLLLANASKFWWFCHMWGHSQPHLFNASTDVIIREMQLNYQFAKENGIPTNSGYVISPHHSGVYPVHEPLYDAWRRIWNAQVTSTEEYPHFKPMHIHRGFIYRDIRVLPRQTCGLYTHTIFLESYPGGKERLERNILGGDLFMTFLYNPINIYMTHLSNYANDRLALYTFENLFQFIGKWTNLELRSAPPLEMAKLYFHMFPGDVDPVWHNPCDDKRHMQIWASSKSCERLPKFLVVGPQKTGTTALYSFLSMHPAIRSNYHNPETFEEVQFFSGKNYHKGLDWYMNFFPLPDNSSAQYLFEKSATYFDGELVPVRAFSLIPRASIIVIVIDPVRRAYSWYQHMRAHGDRTARQHSFLDVISASRDSPLPLRNLRNRCLKPGEYAVHIEKWLDHYPANQLLILDGDELRRSPVSVMHKVQRFLKIKPFIDYTDLLRYDAKKGFYCQVVNGESNRCLGRSKGRRYPPMDAEAEKFLQHYYQPYNVALHKVLTRLNQPVPLPRWLQADLH